MPSRRFKFRSANGEIVELIAAPAAEARNTRHKDRKSKSQWVVVRWLKRPIEFKQNRKRSPE